MVSDRRCAIMLVGVVQVQPQSFEAHLIAPILSQHRQNIHDLDLHIYLMIDLDILLPFL